MAKDRPVRPFLARWFIPAAAACAVVTCAFLVLMLRTRPGDTLATDVDDLGNLFAALAASAGCAAAALRHRGHLRWAWWLLSLGALSWTAGEAIWTWLAVITREAVPFPSLADAFYLGGVPIAAAGILMLRPSSDSIRSRLRAIVDGVLIAVSLLAVSWVTVLGAVWSAGGTSGFSLALSLAYPAGDVLLLSMLVMLAMKVPSGGRLPVVLLIAGVAVTAFSDSGFAYLSAATTYSGTNVIDAGYWAGYFLIGLAGMRAAIMPIRTMASPPPRSRFALVLPYVPILAALMLALVAEYERRLDPFLLSCVTVIVAAVLLRQFLALSDNMELVQNLATREDELRHQADHDALTGLANRGCLMRTLDATLESTTPGESALLFIDVDDLKMINDEYGHAGGDAVLRAVAGVLAASVRKGDLAARLGGDEFAILLTGVSDESQATDVATRILNEMATPLAEFNGNQVDVSASIGIATSNHGVLFTGEELVRRADVAMYAAKAAHKGVAVAWEHRLESTDETAVTWTSDLERAVRDEQFVLVYQPVVETVTQRIVAAEALLRWQHPRYGLLTPDRFVEDLESTGLIVQVGEWVLRTACAQVQAWSKTLGIALDIHVNVSARQLSRTDFPHIVRRALEKSGLDGNRLVLELTETSLVESNRAAGVRLRAVKRLGCRVALDDFGTGYSALAHLHDFPIDMLKVDRSFISELTLDAAKPSLAGVLINLGASIGTTVVAEGVETVEQLRALTAMHCPLYQGFYFSRPVEPERLAALLNNDRKLLAATTSG
ncbi:MAG: putative bifunctional diguanylate cyclase/phosphodiesterase [Candidatus Dormibacteria bacterium]